VQIVYCVWLCFELFFVWAFIVETKGLSLEETVALFDGEEAEAAITHAVADPTEYREEHEKASTPQYEVGNELRA
jgi:hypothetical protein